MSPISGPTYEVLALSIRPTLTTTGNGWRRRMLKGFDIIINGLSDGEDHIIPGHDPLILKKFPPLEGNPEIVRLDLPPVG